jgi:hypothetical protein
MAAAIATDIFERPSQYICPSPTATSYNSQHNARGRRKIDCKPELVISSLQKFYAGRDDLATIIPYLRGEGELSLRLIDWFVTNYCRKHFVGYLLGGQEFLVYVSYKSQLKAYSKQYFDPNCRRERIQFQLPGYEPFLTTVGKLNFFRWAIETNLLAYIHEHNDEIQKERLQAMKDAGSSTDGRSKRSSTESSTISYASAESLGSLSSLSSQRSVTRRKRTKQQPSAASHLQRHDMEIRVSFD